LNITLKYFSWIRVKLKKSHDLIEFNQTISFKELKNNLISKDAIYQEIFEDKSVKFFLNLKEIDDENQTLNNGDILAFLPPVTGG
jgi:molybdopterin converting factor small subunit|tara:strand:+ start:261 stop:515 length:255 start_codon:yes stop_codon:yes gene_type:complete